MKTKVRVRLEQFGNFVLDDEKFREKEKEKKKKKRNGITEWPLPALSHPSARKHVYICIKRKRFRTPGDIRMDG